MKRQRHKHEWIPPAGTPPAALAAAPRSGRRPARLLAAALLAVLPLFLGCAACCGRNDHESLLNELYVSPGLVLSSSPAPRVDPEMFTYRSLWPATEGYLDVGETVFYRVRWRDRQSITPGVRDFSDRIFDRYRVGTQFR